MSNTDVIITLAVPDERFKAWTDKGMTYDRQSTDRRQTYDRQTADIRHKDFRQTKRINKHFLAVLESGTKTTAKSDILLFF